jgi:hypothetical protein
MSDKPSAAEQEFEEWFAVDTAMHNLAADDKRIARLAYLAAIERTARRCVEICMKNRELFGHGSALAIAKEFGLD